MRILLWHGYLLGETGSNIYTRQLAREWLPVICRCALLSQGRGRTTLTSGWRAPMRTTRPPAGPLIAREWWSAGVLAGARANRDSAGSGRS